MFRRALLKIANEKIWALINDVIFHFAFLFKFEFEMSMNLVKNCDKLFYDDFIWLLSTYPKKKGV